MIDAGFGANIKAMSLAEQAFLKDQAQQRLARAEAAGKRPLVPGDLVFYWRRQVAGREKERGFTIGSFVGPARVLAVETRVDDEGRLRPGSCVWLHRAGRLIKAAPEQLRAATDRERAIEELKGPVEIPWTITSLASHPHKKTYDDITSEIPDDMQWDEAAQQPVLSHRIRGKKSCICAHVDDFLFGGAPGDKVHDHLMEQIKQHFSWGSWESSSFTQCGVTVTQHSDFSITLDQQEFVSDLQEIKLSRDRSRQVTAETSDYEKHQLRAVLGALSWFTGQTGFQFSSDVGILLSSVSTSQVETILRTNKLIRDVKDNPGELRIHAFPDAKRLELVCWADAAWANRPDGKSSTEGIVIGFSSPALLEGKIAPVSLMYWRSGKIDRTCRSPACAETKGVVNGEDDLYHLRYLWSEMLLPKERLVGCHPDTVVVNASGTLVTDSKNLWDKLSKEIFVIKGAEKRSDLEALSLKESQDNSQLQLRWVHSDAMLANSLTKPSEKWQILLFQKMKYHWRIVHDSNMVSARKRKAEGIDPMHSEVKG
ncbi:unnamed protein product [Symbiodinium pilosum]|uniref:Reverse transcriptase Ty1/copia-type domain-containing protein n=1 Tax=Symbiodinium pilosum TaxID=2952 RepID=A0A812R7M9_SYMPI|nr:unnamed protein product [Symbiodinium pilosum]